MRGVESGVIFRSVVKVHDVLLMTSKEVRWGEGFQSFELTTVIKSALV